MVTLLKTCKKRGVSILNLFFHSSSLLPGYSPYVQNKKDLEKFLQKIDELFSFAQRSMNIKGITLSGLLSQIGEGAL